MRSSALMRITRQRAIAGMVSLGLLCSLSACGNMNQQTQSENAASGDAQLLPPAQGNVQLFIPSDSFSLSTQTPINTWSELSSAIHAQLQTYGFSAKQISTTKSDSLVGQIDALTQAIDNVPENTPQTFIIAPVLANDDIRQQYGDYVSDSQMLVESSEKSSKTASRVSKDTEQHAEDDEVSAIEQTQQDLKSLAQLIDTAQAQHIRVIELGSPVQTLTPDCVVDLVSAYQIGATQAQELVNKLDITHATTSNPVSIEVFIPSSNDELFARAMFNGVWSVLGQYYTSGVVVSPSGRLSQTSNEDSWSTVDVKETTKDGISAAIAERLGLNHSRDHASSLPKLDGVLSGNDALAQYLADALKQAGYTGSSATINPNISIGGIVKQLAGEADLQRNAVPQPRRQSSTSSTDSKTQVLTWPIITGYGAYTSNLAYIIDGSQWSTSLVNRNAVAQSIAGCVLAYNTNNKPKTVVRQIETKVKQQQQSNKQQGARQTVQPSSWDTVHIDRVAIPQVSQSLLAVSASNLKSVLIDGQYISPADAGL